MNKRLTMEDKLGDNEWSYSVFEESKEKAMGVIFKNFCLDYFNSHPTELYKYVPEKYKGDFYKYMSRRSKGSDYWFITVNPEGDLKPEEIKKYVDKSLKKKYVENHYGSYEFRKCNTGCHVHMLIKVNQKKKRAEIQREFFSTFKKICGTKNHVYVLGTRFPQNVINYIEGYKKDKEGNLVKKTNGDQDDEYWEEHKLMFPRIFGEKTFLD